jgi:predicted AAA+ superfamily ATPase
MRNDMGAIWENFAILELMKYHHYQEEHYNYYFRRTHQQNEIDFIAQKDGVYNTYEIKR